MRQVKKNKKRTISFSPPDITDIEIAEVCETLRSGWITTGPRTKELEKRLSQYCHTNKVVCLNSATAAEELNLRILGIGEGDEVIVPAYTYTATAAAAIHCGARVVLIDSKKNSPEMDYDQMEAAINEKTKAIVGVDIGGIICNYDRIFEAAQNKKKLFIPKTNIQKLMGRIAVLADGAHSLGAVQNGRMSGEIADFTSFSFHAVKNFTTAEGGAATWKHIEGIDDEMIYKQYQLFSLHGQSKDAFAKTQLGAWEYDVVKLGYKCNMTDIMAAIGLKQLDRYEELLERRRDIIEKYDEMCDEIGIMHLKHYGDNYSSSGHLYLTRIPNITLAERADIMTELAKQGVATNVHYKPLPLMTAYRQLGWDMKDFPNAYDYFANLITLPLHTKLSDEDVEYICEMVKEALKEYMR